MAKVPFTKLKCKINEDTIPVQIGEEIIAVKQYLPIQEKLSLIGRVMEWAHDQDKSYSNPVKAKVYTELEFVFTYTNITFTDKQKEDLPKLYDLLSSSGVLNEILTNIPKEELDIIWKGIEDTIESFYKYQNSILGIMDSIKQDYDNFNLDWEQMEKTIKDPEALKLLRSILINFN